MAKKKPPAKTNAMRLLDGLGVAYEAREYEVDEADLSATTVAEKVGLHPMQVFKTLLLAGEGEYLFAVIAATQELDLKALAALAGKRKVELVPVKELLRLTGYIRGGVTVIGAAKPFPAYVDETVELFDQISVSAGVRGTQLLLPPEEYLRAVRALCHEQVFLGGIGREVPGTA